jgi:hypothetical protein
MGGEVYGFYMYRVLLSFQIKNMTSIPRALTTKSSAENDNILSSSNPDQFQEDETK